MPKMSYTPSTQAKLLGEIRDRLAEIRRESEANQSNANEIARAILNAVEEITRR